MARLQSEQRDASPAAPSAPSQDSSSPSLISDVQAAVAQIEQRMASAHASASSLAPPASPSTLGIAFASGEHSSAAPSTTGLYVAASTDATQHTLNVVSERVGHFERSGPLAMPALRHDVAAVPPPPPMPNLFDTTDPLDQSELERIYDLPATLLQPGQEDALQDTTGSSIADVVQRFEDAVNNFASIVPGDFPAEGLGDLAKPIAPTVEQFEAPPQDLAPALDTVDIPLAPIAPTIEQFETPTKTDVPVLDTVDIPSVPIAPTVEQFETPIQTDVPVLDTVDIPSVPIAPTVEQFETPTQTDVPTANTFDIPLAPIAPTVEQFEKPAETEQVTLEHVGLPSVPIAPTVAHFESPVEGEPIAVEPVDMPSISISSTVAKLESPGQLKTQPVELIDTRLVPIQPTVEQFETQIETDTRSPPPVDADSVAIAPSVEQFEALDESEAPAPGPVNMPSISIPCLVAQFDAPVDVETPTAAPVDMPPASTIPSVEPFETTGESEALTAKPVNVTPTPIARTVEQFDAPVESKTPVVVPVDVPLASSAPFVEQFNVLGEMEEAIETAEVLSSPNDVPVLENSEEPIEAERPFIPPVDMPPSSTVPSAEQYEARDETEPLAGKLPEMTTAPTDSVLELMDEPVEHNAHHVAPASLHSASIRSANARRTGELDTSTAKLGETPSQVAHNVERFEYPVESNISKDEPYDKALLPNVSAVQKANAPVMNEPSATTANPRTISTGHPPLHTDDPKEDVPCGEPSAESCVPDPVPRDKCEIPVSVHLFAEKHDDTPSMLVAPMVEQSEATAEAQKSIDNPVKIPSVPSAPIDDHSEASLEPEIPMIEDIAVDVTSVVLSVQAPPNSKASAVSQKVEHEDEGTLKMIASQPKTQQMTQSGMAHAPALEFRNNSLAIAPIVDRIESVALENEDPERSLAIDQGRNTIPGGAAAAVRVDAQPATVPSQAAHFVAIDETRSSMQVHPELEGVPVSLDEEMETVFLASQSLAGTGAVNAPRDGKSESEAPEALSSFGAKSQSYLGSSTDPTEKINIAVEVAQSQTLPLQTPTSTSISSKSEPLLDQNAVGSAEPSSINVSLDQTVGNESPNLAVPLPMQLGDDEVTLPTDTPLSSEEQEAVSTEPLEIPEIDSEDIAIEGIEDQPQSPDSVPETELFNPSEEVQEQEEQEGSESTVTPVESIHAEQAVTELPSEPHEVTEEISSPPEEELAGGEQALESGSVLSESNGHLPICDVLTRDAGIGQAADLSSNADTRVEKLGTPSGDLAPSDSSTPNKSYIPIGVPRAEQGDSWESSPKFGTTGAEVVAESFDDGSTLQRTATSSERESVQTDVTLTALSGTISDVPKQAEEVLEETSITPVAQPGSEGEAATATTSVCTDAERPRIGGKEVGRSVISDMANHGNFQPAHHSIPDDDFNDHPTRPESSEIQTAIKYVKDTDGGFGREAGVHPRSVVEAESVAPNVPTPELWEETVATVDSERPTSLSNTRMVEDSVENIDEVAAMDKTSLPSTPVKPAEIQSEVLPSSLGSPVTPSTEAPPEGMPQNSEGGGVDEDTGISPKTGLSRRLSRGARTFTGSLSMTSPKSQTPGSSETTNDSASSDGVAQIKNRVKPMIVAADPSSPTPRQSPGGPPPRRLDAVGTGDSISRSPTVTAGDRSLPRLPRVAELTGNESREKASSRSVLPRVATFSGALPREGTTYSSSRGGRNLFAIPRGHPNDSDNDSIASTPATGSTKPRFFRRTMSFTHSRRSTVAASSPAVRPPVRAPFGSNAGRRSVNVASSPSRKKEDRRATVSLSESSISRPSRGEGFSLPPFSPPTIPRSKPTVPKPFRLSGLELHEKAVQRLEEARKKAEENESRRPPFKPTPLPGFYTRRNLQG